ncbi:hypothetical protein MPSEU_000839100 [Mayamaea pseudoterrestris]|nr:hypothetical protein MPSEU_000839100 [Mayamaea pseudoterrestris]
MASSARSSGGSAEHEDDVNLYQTRRGRNNGGKSLEACFAMYKSRLPENDFDRDSVSSADMSTYESIEASSASSIYETTTTDSLEDCIFDSESKNYASASGTASDSTENQFAPTPHAPHDPLPPMIHLTGDSKKFDFLSAYATSLLGPSPSPPCQLHVDVPHSSLSGHDVQDSLAHINTTTEFLNHLDFSSNAFSWPAISDIWDPGQADSPLAAATNAASELALVLQAEIDVQKAGNNAKFRRWTPQEDALLLMAVQEHFKSKPFMGTQIPFRAIAKKYFDDNRNGYQCKSRYRKIRPDVNRTSFTQAENDTILEMQRQGCTFSDIAKQLENRTTDQVRNQFNDKLDPNLHKMKHWSDEEKRILFDAQKRMGNKWMAISKLLPGRSENDVKNQWHNTKTKQRRNMRRAMMSQTSEAVIDSEELARVTEV